MRGPSIDWGIILLKPGELMGDKAHGHNIIDETFYFVEGDGIMIIDDKKYPAPQGSVFLCEVEEMHNIRNDSEKPIKIIFIKGEYKPEDKIWIAIVIEILGGERMRVFCEDGKHRIGRIRGKIKKRIWVKIPKILDIDNITF